MKLTLVDYGAGNVASVERAFHRLGAETERAATPETLASAQVIVLPGVGHMAALAQTLRARSMTAVLREKLLAGCPFLGICLGLQFLYEASAESASEPCLGLLPGKVERLRGKLKLPHMGWNQVQRLQPSRLIPGSGESSHFYFAHSFGVVDADRNITFACEYGAPFAAVVERENLFGVQFHPEKSAGAGALLLRSFLELAR